MCMFPIPNKSSIKARIKGVEEFDCGGCPECLGKKSRLWALRCAMEAKVNVGCMITLTYDTYKNGEKGEENPVDTSLRVNKEHCQRFIKRLRKAYPQNKIKYLITAEYGKRTHRAHYHALIFGIKFNDLRYYKKSKRGNIIYKSKTLEKIWQGDKEHKGGICTVDCVNPSAQVARYCTKYCAKDSGVDDTFMLFSRDIGESELKRLFNGKSYWIDGREYSIPKKIWQWYIENKYNINGYSRYVGKLKVESSEKRLCGKLDKIEREKEVIELKIIKKEERINNLIKLYPKKKRVNSKMRAYLDPLIEEVDDTIRELKNRLKELESLRDLLWKKEYNILENNEITYNRAKEMRDYFCAQRDNDSVYKNYINYWQRKNRVNEISRPSILTRVLQLPDNKYRSYKLKALDCLILSELKYDFVPPRTKSQAFIKFKRKKVVVEKSFAPLSRHYRANDTAKKEKIAYKQLCGRKIIESMEKCEEFRVLDNPFSPFYKYFEKK